MTGMNHHMQALLLHVALSQLPADERKAARCALVMLHTDGMESVSGSEVAQSAGVELAVALRALNQCCALGLVRPTRLMERWCAGWRSSAQ